MRFQWIKPEAEQVWQLLEKYKYVLIILAAGLILLLWPTGEKEKRSEIADHSVPE